MRKVWKILLKNDKKYSWMECNYMLKFIWIFC
nr:MAG TPA: hypothetical protein [Caudoviricetes sp.]